MSESGKKKSASKSKNWVVIAQGLAPIAAFAAWATMAVLWLFSISDEPFSLRDILLAIGAVVAAPVGLWLSFRRTQALDVQNTNAQEALTHQALAERNTRLAKAFTDATTQLGSERAHIRAAACHAIGQIALEDWRQAQADGKQSAYYATCIDILSGFIRDKCGEEAKDAPKDEDGEPAFADDYRLPADIEAALTAASNCNRATDGAHSLDLRGADLRCWKGLMTPLDLTNSSFDNARFGDVHFKNSRLRNTNFRIHAGQSVNFSGCYIKNLDTWLSDIQTMGASNCIIQDSEFFVPTKQSNDFYDCVFKSGSIIETRDAQVDFHSCGFISTHLTLASLNSFKSDYDRQHCYYLKEHPPLLKQRTAMEGYKTEEINPDEHLACLDQEEFDKREGGILREMKALV